ncbi:MAG: ATPase domain-containing protein [Thermodesulfobacteriota bacterium]
MEDVRGVSPVRTNGDERVSTGVDGLDDVLGGGLPHGHVYLIEGSPGTGKTTLALQFLLEGARLGEQCLYVIMSESKKELSGVARSHGWSLDPLSIIELTPAAESLLPEEQYTVFHPAEVELGDTMRAVFDEVERLRPSRVVFDSLAEMRMLSVNSSAYRRQVLALKQFFVGRNCTVLFLDNHMPAAAEHHLRSVAHGVILLEQIPLGYGVKRRRLDGVKLQGAQFREGYHDYNIRPGGIVVSPGWSRRNTAGRCRPLRRSAAGCRSSTPSWAGGWSEGLAS